MYRSRNRSDSFGSDPFNRKEIVEEAEAGLDIPSDSPLSFDLSVLEETLALKEKAAVKAWTEERNSHDPMGARFYNGCEEEAFLDQEVSYGDFDPWAGSSGITNRADEMQVVQPDEGWQNRPDEGWRNLPMLKVAAVKDVSAVKPEFFLNSRHRQVTLLFYN
ncbi:hypothetical protein CYMTET_16463, partial [Cymbomonas tetramitiformis]